MHPGHSVEEYALDEYIESLRFTIAEVTATHGVVQKICLTGGAQ